MIDIIEYDPKYDEDIKDLFVELQEYIASIDREKYNILTDEYRETNFSENMQEIEENSGKMFLAKVDDKVIGLIIGIILEEEDTYDFKAPKGGRITELIVSKNCRSKGIGQLLLNKMEEHFRSVGCKRIIIEVFEYNDMAKNFYYKNDYFNRTTDIMKKLD